MPEGQRQPSAKKKAKANSTKADDKGVFFRENRSAIIKVLDAIGAIGLFAAGMLASTSHRHIAVWTLFTALSSFVAAVYLTWLPKLNRSAQWKQAKIKRVFVSAEVLVILLCVGLQIWAWLQIDTQSPKPLLPFTENTESVTISVGGMSLVAPRKSLESAIGTPIVISDFTPVRLKLKDGNLYADVEMFGGGASPVVLKDNELTVRPPEWETNSSAKALEVVNRNKQPIFQLIYKSQSHIQVNGFFWAKGRLVYASEGVVLVSPAQEDIEAHPLKPIFKYPAWKYPSQYAD